MMAEEDEAERHWHEVLVVEDERDVRDAISHLLTFQTFTARSANDGNQALAHLLDGYRPCLILLDLSMPSMDGLAFRSAQQALADCVNIPVVVVSGREDGQEIAGSLGGCPFLKKPVRPTTLLAAVEQHCRFRRKE
jgi:DNA-binding response OmpR family regulator